MTDFTSAPATPLGHGSTAEATRRPSLLARAVGVRAALPPGTGPVALRWAIHAGLLMISYYVLKTLREPLLLTEGSAELKSYAHAAIACILLVLVPLYGAVYRRTQRHHLVRGITLLFGAALLFLYALGRAGVDVGFVYYVWVGLFGVVVPTQLWAHAAGSYSPESGQKVFPLIMIGASAGALIGPKLASTLYAALGPWNVMLIALFLVAATLPLVGRTAVAAPPTQRDGACSSEQRLLGGLSLVLRDRYLLLLAALAVLLNCVNSIGEYILSDLVKRDAAARVAAHPDLDAGELIIAFFGNFHFAVNAVALLVQLLLVSRVFRWAGVQGALLVLPLVALLGYGLIAVLPLLAVVHMIKLIENSVDYSLMNTARHSLYLPLPAAHQYEGKTAIDTCFWRLGDLLQAGLIFAGIHLFELGLGHFALINVAVVAVWLVVAVRVGDRYPIRPPRSVGLSRRAPTIAASAAAIGMAALALQAEDVAAAEEVAAEGLLFAGRDPLAITLEADFRALCRRGPERCEALAAALIYSDANDVQHRVAVSLRARGLWRASTSHCSLPPLFIHIEEPASHTALLGAHPPVLALTTHCRVSPSAYEQYVLKEYLAYRAYNVVSDESLRVRLAHVTYRDTRRARRTTQRYAVIVEHFAALAARLGSVVTPAGEVALDHAEPSSVAALELFQYMIGNTDWSISGGHNILHLRRADGRLIVVPFDFDFAGLVDAAYAGPPPQLPIRRVTQRLFRGLCRPAPIWDREFEEYAARRVPIERLLDETAALDPAHRSHVERFLGSFFNTLESQQGRTAILRECRAR